VSDRVQVVSGFATDGDSSGDYETVNITIRKAAGSDDINISDVTYTYLGPGETATGTLDGISRSAVSGNDDYLRNSSDRVEVSVALGTDFGTALSPGDEFELQLTTSSGASTYIKGRIPESAEDGGVVEV
jgi:archaellin